MIYSTDLKPSVVELLTMLGGSTFQSLREKAKTFVL